MSDIYAMQRANCDCFALDDHGRFRVPLFHSRHDAMIARSRNLEMLLFKPVPLNARLLKELVPIGGGSDVDFWLVKDPLLSLNRGRLVEHAQLALLISEEKNESRPDPGSPIYAHKSDESGVGEC